MMNEMVNLCLNLNIQVIGKKIVNIRKINASTLIGKGTLNKILSQVNEKKLNLLYENKLQFSWIFSSSSILNNIE